VFLVDASFSMADRAPSLRNTVHQFLLDGLQGELRRGDMVHLWTFSEQPNATVFRPRSWDPATSESLARQTFTLISRLRFEGQTRMDRLIPAMAKAAESAEAATFILLSDAEGRISGTPFDAELNALYRQRRREMRRNREAFVTCLVSQGGAFVAWAGKSSSEAVREGIVPRISPSPAPLAVARPSPPQPAVLPPISQSAPEPPSPNPIVAPDVAAQAPAISTAPVVAETALPPPTAPPLPSTAATPEVVAPAPITTPQTSTQPQPDHADNTPLAPSALPTPDPDQAEGRPQTESKPEPQQIESRPEAPAETESLNPVIPVGVVETELASVTQETSTPSTSVSSVGLATPAPNLEPPLPLEPAPLEVIEQPQTPSATPPPLPASNPPSTGSIAALPPPITTFPARLLIVLGVACLLIAAVALAAWRKRSKQTFSGSLISQSFSGGTGGARKVTRPRSSQIQEPPSTAENG
jgi:hypothetical protein